MKGPETICSNEYSKKYNSYYGLQKFFVYVKQQHGGRAKLYLSTGLTATA